MKIKNQIENNLGAILIGTIFVIFSYLLYLVDKYGWSTLLLFGLILLLKQNSLKELVFNMSEGFRAKFRSDPEKIKDDIKENQESITNLNFARFQYVEAKILREMQERYGGELKTKIHYVYCQPNKPEFRYTPDGSLMTNDTLYFFEIKYVLKTQFAKNIVNNTLSYLNDVYLKLLPSIGGKKFVIKLILASEFDLSKTHFVAPYGIEIEYFKL